MLSSLLLTAAIAGADPDASVTNIRAVHRDGQTFITWKDAAEGAAGAKYRYNLYRTDQPISADNLAAAELCYHGLFNNSAKLFGSAFNDRDRLDPAKPYSVIENGGNPLPPWSGLAVVTVRDAGKRYYAIVATDEQSKPVGKVVPGQNATIEAVNEMPGKIQAIKLYDSKDRQGPYVRNTTITGQKNLPLHIILHGSQGGGAGEYGDYFLHFGTPEMGYRDGLPGVFSVTESHAKEGNHLSLRPRDALEHPTGRAMESYWFGYYCTPQWAKHTEPRVYPFTEQRLLWMTRWAIEHYGADPNRITMGGSSSGAVGSMNVGFRHPELFAAVFPSSGRVRKVQAVGFDAKFDRDSATAVMADGTTKYYECVDGPRFVASHPGDLPFIGWAVGRQDGYATWPEMIDLVKVLTEGHHGFAFSWNNGNHGGGASAMHLISKYYPHDKFALNRSYPAFGNSSINHEMGPGDAKEGDLVGGINLGFDWTDVVDKPGEWSVRVTNDLAKAEMTVDITPRRGQAFKPKAGELIRWSTSLGGSGEVAADRNGLVTVRKVPIRPGQATQLTLTGVK
jgi:hypothetical protein